MSDQFLKYRNFFLSAPTREALQLQLLDLQARLPKEGDLSEAEMNRGLVDAGDSHAFRVGMVYSGAASLHDALTSGLKRFKKTDRSYFQTRQGFYYHRAEPGFSTGKLAFLYPGFGSEYAGMGAGLEDFWPDVDAWFCYVEDAMKAWFFGAVEPDSPNAAKRLGEHGQSGHLLAMALTGILKQQGLCPDVIGGHSNGENSALYAAGVARCESRAHELQAMAEITATANSNASEEEIGEFIIVGQVTCSELESIVADFDGRVVIAMENCANQFVLFASAGVSVDSVVQKVLKRGVAFPFSRNQGFHTRFFKSRESMVDATYAHLDFGIGHTSLYSCISADLFSGDRDSIVQTARRQWFERVRFREMIERMYADGVRNFIEVGPNNRLSGFVNDILRGRGCLVAASSLPGKSGCEQIAHLLAQGFVYGLKVKGLFAPLDVGQVVGSSEVIQSDESANAGSSLGPSGHPRPKLSVGPLLSGGLDQSTRAELLIRHEALMRQCLSAEGAVTGLLMQRLNRRGVEERSCPSPQTSGDSSLQSRGPMPFLGEQCTRSEGSLSVSRVLERDKDLFIFDHTFGKSTGVGDDGPLPVLPFAISVEIAVEAASLLREKSWVQFELSDVRGVDWVILREAEHEIRISAQAVDAVTTRVELSQCREGAAPSAFWSGNFVELSADSSEVEALPRLEIDRARLRKPIMSGQSYYQDVLFHGPMFQGIVGVSGVSENAIEAVLEMPDFSNAVSGCDSSLCLTSPSLADCVGQLAAFWALEYMDDKELAAFPFKVERTRYLSPTPVVGSRIHCIGKVRVIGQSILEADFDYYNSDGTLYAQYRGFSQRFYRNRYIPRMIYQQPHEVHFSDPVDLVGDSRVLSRRIDHDAIVFLAGSHGFWANVLAYLVLSPQERNEWVAKTKHVVGPGAIRWLIEIALVKDIYREWYREGNGGHSSLLSLTVGRDSSQELEVYPAGRAELGIRIQLQEQENRLEGVWRSDVECKRMARLSD